MPFPGKNAPQRQCPMCEKFFRTYTAPHRGYFCSRACFGRAKILFGRALAEGRIPVKERV